MVPLKPNSRRNADSDKSQNDNHTANREILTKYGLKPEQLIGLIQGLKPQELSSLSEELFGHDKKELTVPVEIFSTDAAPLKSLVTYLRKQGMKNQKVAGLLNRNRKTISQAYNERLILPDVKASKHPVPISVFSDRRLSILESLVVYLRRELSLHDIARILNRDNRTIWTVESRAKKKGGVKLE